MLKADPAERLEYIRKASAILNTFFSIGERGVKISPIGRFEYSEIDKKWHPTEMVRNSDLEGVEKSL